MWVPFVVMFNDLMILVVGRYPYTALLLHVCFCLSDKDLLMMVMLSCKKGSSEVCTVCVISTRGLSLRLSPLRGGRRPDLGTPGLHSLRDFSN